ncbi:MAG TPA: TonB-dependent receptor, partial [Terriglobales bacterium]|nr:TonB-dependent receptor [Terriglobales bacterium]
MDFDFRRTKALSLLVVLLCGALAFGQGIITGSMSGTVLDQQAAVIAGAHVRAVQAGTNTEFKGQTDSRGFFQLRDLPVGTYTVYVEMDKFSTLKMEGVEINSGRDTTLGDRVLTVGQESQQVTVEASAPLIETQSSQVSTTFETKQIEFLPHTTGGFDNLALFVPGVANNGAANFSNTNGAAIANNGLRGRTNNFQIDGQANNDNSIGGPLVFVSNPDAIGELQIVSNNFGAEYGRNSGTVVNYVTKSGTNSFHGSGFDYNEGNWSFSRSNQQKNELLGICPDGVAVGASTPYASKCRADTIPRYVENKWGGTFGGPIKRNRAWFFGSFQNDKQRSGTISSTTSLFPTNDANGIGALQALFPNSTGLTGYANVLSP